MPNEDQSDNLTFSPDYVKELRTENASWRLKVRELESKVMHNEVAVELARRGINIDPSIVNIPEGMPISEVVDKFAGIFQAAEQPQANTRPTYPNAITPNSSKANASSPPAQGAFGGRSMKEVEADPKAREQLRTMYREMVRGGSYGSNETIYDS